MLTIDYALKLREMITDVGVIRETGTLLRAIPEIVEELGDPKVSQKKKDQLIDGYFQPEARDFIRMLMKNNALDEWENIFIEYGSLGKVLPAELIYVTEPSIEQKISIKAFIVRRYRDIIERERNTTVVFTEKKDPTLGGGFILRVGRDEYDWSTKGRQEQFEKKLATLKKDLDGSDSFMDTLKASVSSFELEATSREVGTVETVGDGIAHVVGLDHVMYGEVVVFESGVRGMVQNISEDDIGVILFGNEGEVGEGSRVTSTGRQAGISVSEGYLGRIVNALGDPIDGGDAIRADGYRPIEQPAPGIIDRKSVNKPMETGILSIDSMFPIGRGQRELIIGDRQTGKTSIAMDTILNQKGKDVVCIYVAIGQKASTIASIANNLRKHDALDYTIIVAATAAEPASMQYIAPYAATSLGEYFMYAGRDVLIVYDDLSKHAVAYRALSLLLGRAPGREAYPGDVFYLHSRLLERSSHLTQKLGGGSMTALPIIETQDGDVSAYIPTNVISITDGQIFLESDLFFEGQRPAVNVGLSVSRVGGAAQTKAMKRASGSLRIDLAQYREMEAFTQFSSDLDEATANTLSQGRVLMELLKQPLNHPLSMTDQVVTLVVAENRKMMDIPPKEVKKYQAGLLAYVNENCADIVKSISSTGLLSDDQVRKLLAANDAFRSQWDAQRKGA